MKSSLYESGERLPKGVESPQRTNNRAKTQSVQKLRDKHTLKYLLYAAELSKSSFYYSLKQPDKDEADKAAVLQLFERHRGRYGHRRIAATLCWNKKKAARIMQLLGLTAELLSNLVYGIQAAFSVDCSSSCLPSLKMTLLTTKVNKLNP